ncbi:RNA polymerase III subunit Rpc25 [Nakaseomyces glabratus]
MFILTKLKDLVRIPPDQFHRDAVSAITHELNVKYSNKVVPHVGLSVSVYDLLEVDEGQLRPGDGASYINVTFRCVVFKPFAGEILTGWIKRCDGEGIQVSMMGLFDDIFIPKKMLFEGSYYSPEDGAWVWPMDEETKLYLDVNEMIRFRVEEEVFVDVKPPSPKELELERERELQLQEQHQHQQQHQQESKLEKPPAYALLGSCQTDGMGLVSWWD